MRLKSSFDYRFSQYQSMATISQLRVQVMVVFVSSMNCATHYFAVSVNGFSTMHATIKANPSSKGITLPLNTICISFLIIFHRRDYLRGVAKRRKKQKLSIQFSLTRLWYIVLVVLLTKQLILNLARFIKFRQSTKKYELNV